MSLIAPSPGSRSQVLRHLRHMMPRQKNPPGGKFANQAPSSWAQHTPKYVQPHDRIAYWNIIPGDEVVVRRGWASKKRGEDGKMHKVRYEGRVSSIDRERNVAWLTASEDAKNDDYVPKHKAHISPMLKDAEKPEEGYIPNMIFKARPIHYSNLQLKLPKDLKLPNDVKLDLKAGVVARKLSRSAVKYDAQRGHFTWDRYALVSTEEGTVQVQIPWRKRDPRPKTRQSYATNALTVDEETWIPWQPTDPLWMLPRKQRTTPHAIERNAAQLKQREQSALESSQTGGMSSTSSTDNLAPNGLKYEPAFAKRKGVKPPPIPQAPTPAEQVWQARREASEWAVALEDRLQENIKPSSNAKVDLPHGIFSAFDYLRIAPHEGPASKGWQGLAATPEEGRVGLDEFATTKQMLKRVRNVAATGAGYSAGNSEDKSLDVSKHEVDAWPIELLMKGDLVNELGSKHRRRRWQAKYAEKQAMRLIDAEMERQNLEALRSVDL